MPFAEGPLELDADEVIGKQLEVFVGDRGAKDVLEQGFAGARVVGAGMGRGVEREAHLGDRKGRRDGDTGAAP